MSEFDTTMLPGGTIRISPRSEPQEAMQASYESVKVHTGVIREDGSGQFARYGHEPEAPAPGGSVMASLRNNVGSQKVDSTSTVDIGGMRTSLAVAESLGLVKRNANGTYEDVQGAPPVAQQAPQESAGSGPELAPAAEEAAFGEAIADMRQDSYDSAAALAATAVVDQTDVGWLAVASRLAKSEGIDPDIAAEKVEQAHSFFTRQVDRVCDGLGIKEPDSFYEWLQTNKPRELTAATQALIGQRSTADFRTLAIEWKTGQANAQLAQWRSMGMDAFTDRDTGEVMVSRDGKRPVRARDL